MAVSASGKSFTLSDMPAAGQTTRKGGDNSQWTMRISCGACLRAWHFKPPRNVSCDLHNRGWPSRAADFPCRGDNWAIAHVSFP